MYEEAVTARLHVALQEIALEPDPRYPESLNGTLRVRVYADSVGEPVWFDIGIAAAAARAQEGEPAGVRIKVASAGDRRA